jgi:hypothetical protein
MDFSSTSAFEFDAVMVTLLIIDLAMCAGALLFCATFPRFLRDECRTKMQC